MTLRLSGQHDSEPIRLLLPEGRTVLGSSPDAGLVLALPTISRHHAELDVSPEGLLVRDLQSSNGTRIDGKRVDNQSEARPGQTLQFGEIRLAIEAVAGGDDRIGAELPRNEPDVESNPGATLPPVTLNLLAFEQLPRLLNTLRQDTSRIEFARRLGEALWESLPLTRLKMLDQRGSEAVLFDAGSETCEREVSGDAFGVSVVFAFSQPVGPAQEESLLALVKSLLGQVEDSPSRSDAVPGPGAPLPDPPPLDPDVQTIYKRAQRAGRSAISVLIRGESGTGKELLARFIHACRADADRPFIAINCAALTSDLLEAELFGIEKGVATGVDGRAGCFELAHGGSLFLDEIGDMPKDTQAKILRVIQEGEVVRVGGSKRIPARPRLISATNRDLERMLADETFRLDLLHRIAGWEVTLPPLRDRPADLANLALHFLGRYCAEQGVSVRGISQRALALLRDYHWPGNVRELQQEMHRVSVFLGQGDVLSSEDLGPAIRQAQSGPVSSASLEDRLAQHERSILKHALATHDGNVSQAAESLSIARSTFYRRMGQLGMDARKED